MSLRSIARCLDVSVAALYYYYPAKDDLLTDLLQPHYDRLARVIEDAPSGSSPTEREARIDHVLSGVLEMTLADPARVALASGDAAVRHHPVHGPRLAAAHGVLRHLLGSASEADDAALLGSAALSALVGPVMNLADLDPERARTALLPAVKRLLTKGP